MAQILTLPATERTTTLGGKAQRLSLKASPNFVGSSDCRGILLPARRWALGVRSGSSEGRSQVTTRKYPVVLLGERVSKYRYAKTLKGTI